VTATTGATDTSSGASGAIAPPTLLDRDAFLKLLVAQLRYQDPSKPMDPTEMVSQTAQLSVVDKLAEISTQLRNAATADRLAIAGSIVGKQIAFDGEDGLPTSAVVRWARFEGDSIVLGTDRVEVPLDAVLAVSGPPAPPASPAAPATTA
jgi:flagellar hook assembly protein FlgD